VTGRIKSLSSGNGSGFISADDGTSVHFVSSAVLEYDVSCLAAGQLVTFDLEGGGLPTAVNVCVQRQHRLPLTLAKHQEAASLRYVGFDQSGSLRLYKFERIVPGESIQKVVVTADLALFRKYEVGIQEGPALCLRSLEGAAPSSGSRRQLTDKDMLAHLASRPAPRPRPRHIPPPRHPAKV
jgi:cold shock CspA family protein